MCSNTNHQYKFGKKLNKRFHDTYKISTHNKNKCILLLCKGVYPYEYIDDWEKFNETSLPEKKDFDSDLNREDIPNANYAHTKRICKGFEIKNLRKYHDLYVRSYTLLLADVLENFRNICLEIYEL